MNIFANLFKCIEHIMAYPMYLFGYYISFGNIFAFGFLVSLAGYLLFKLIF